MGISRFVWSLGATAVLGAGMLVAVPPAMAANLTVSNGLSTADLGSVGVSPTVLAQDLAGPGVTVSNVAFHGASSQAGRLHALDPAVVSFNDGVILSSGNVADVVGPNKSEGTTGDMGGSSDPDLDALIKDSQTVNPVTFDAASLEFDFVPTADTVYFTYVFGSDEYLEWVNLFNDVFGFYVNGQNCATVANGSPVSIDTINDTVNPGLYRDNSYWNPPTQPINIESDGLSVELICQASVQPGVTNHMKLAIADTSDQILDSVVMLKSNSLSVNKPESCNDGIDNDDDSAIDMEDSSCTASTTPAPVGGSGLGSANTAPPFTGNEGVAIPLDAAALGWEANDETVSTSWTVTGINGTDADCTIDPPGKQPLNQDGSIAVVSAYCPVDGEYVARVDGWDVENKSAFDYDVDFFVHNAPPAVNIDSPATDSSVDVGAPVDLVATLSDPGADDSVSCDINWGDGDQQSGDLADGVCTQTHEYASAGQYLISVKGQDNVGSSSAAAVLISVGSGAASVPAAPETPTVVRANQAAKLSWTAPADGGSPVDGYNVQVATDPAGPFTDAVGCSALPESANTCKATGLTNGTGYYFTVAAHNAVGWSDPSGVSSQVVPATYPGTTTGVSVSGSGPGALTASWIAPAADGGAVIDGYQVYFYRNGSSSVAKSCSVGESATSCALSGLTQGSYRVRVRAHNAVGWAGLSVLSAAAVINGIPGGVQGVGLTSAGPGKLTASWTAPVSDGGLTIDAYRIYVYRNGSSSATKICDVSGSARACAMSGLRQGEYVVQVKAHNPAGWGSLSAVSPKLSISGIPGVATSVAVSSPAPGQLTATWGAPVSDGGAAIDRYQVRLYRDGVATSKYCYTGGSGAACTFTGLAAGTYQVTVTARNAAGYGSASPRSAGTSVG